MDEEDLQLTEQISPEGWSVERNYMGRNAIVIKFKKSLKACWEIVCNAFAPTVR